MLGRMVRASGGGQMKLVGVHGGVGVCLFVDSDGRILKRHILVHYLEPMVDAMRPRSLWPTVGHVDLLDVEQEQRASAEEKRLKRRAAKRAKRSNKIKRRAPVAA